MKYLLDTCVLSDFARGDAHTLAHVKTTSPALIGVSSVSLMEIEFGLALNPAKARKLAPVMHALFQAATILPYGQEDARATATLRASLQKRGRPIGAYDALIAGCALARGLVLVTSNEGSFVVSAACPWRIDANAKWLSVFLNCEFILVTIGFACHFALGLFQVADG